MQKTQLSIDYDTYREIIHELMQPIQADGLDIDTLKRLYESKLVYLENLRVKCFVEVNAGGAFTMTDYGLILDAQKSTKRFLRELMMMAITDNLARRERNLKIS